MGSKSDMDTMSGAQKVLEDAGVKTEMRVMSAHRDPETVTDYCVNAKMRGLRVIIAGRRTLRRRCPVSPPRTPTFLSSAFRCRRA